MTEKEQYSLQNEFIAEQYGFIDGASFPGVWMTYRSFMYYNGLDTIVVPELDKAVTQAIEVGIMAEARYQEQKKKTIIGTIGGVLLGGFVAGLVFVFGGS